MWELPFSYMSLTTWGVSCQVPHGPLYPPPPQAAVPLSRSPVPGSPLSASCGVRWLPARWDWRHAASSAPAPAAASVWKGNKDGHLMRVSCSRQSDSQTRGWHKFSKLNFFHVWTIFWTESIFCDQKNNKPSGSHCRKLRTNLQVQTERISEKVH